MWIKKLLLSLVMFAFMQGFRTGDSVNGNAAHAPDAAGDAIAQAGSPVPASSPDELEQPPSDASPSPGSLPLRSPRLSKLLLPLPPLLLPELLLPPYDFPSFNSERLDQELQLYLRFLRTYGKPDVLVIGSSRSLQGIDPSAMEEALAEQGYTNMKVFNFGVNGATAQVINLVLQEVLTPEQLPRLIIWGDGSRAFNSGRPDITFNGILASEGYARVEQGDRPIPSRVDDWEVSMLTAARKSAEPTKTEEGDIAPGLDANGFEAISTQFDPETYYQQFPWVAGAYDADYQNFNLWGEQTEAMIDAAAFARSKGITLLVVNLPLTRDYMVDSTRRRYEQQFQQHMWQLAAQEKFMFRDLSQQPNLIHHHYFEDPSHINQQGARAVAFHLVQDKTIPWQLLRPPAKVNSETSSATGSSAVNDSTASGATANDSTIAPGANTSN